MFDNLLIAVHAFLIHLLRSLSVDEILSPKFGNFLTNFGGSSFNVEIASSCFEGDALAPFEFMICRGYVARMSIDQMKDNGRKQNKTRSRRNLTETITDAEYTTDFALRANTPAPEVSAM